MAGTLLHIVLAERALEKAQLQMSTKQEILRCLQDFRLGSILFDLPYYERLLSQGFQRLLCKEISFNSWGGALHAKSPTGLCRFLLDTADCENARATALGALTHAAVDIVFHPKIESFISPTDKYPLRRHQHIETQMDFIVHRHLLKHLGLGTPYTKNVLTIKPHDSWVTNFKNAIEHIHGKHPSQNRISGWLKGLHAFGLLHSSPKWFWVPSVSASDENLKKTAIRSADEAVKLSARYIEIGIEYINKAVSLYDFEAAIPDLDLATGKPAIPAENQLIK